MVEGDGLLQVMGKALLLSLIQGSVLHNQPHVGAVTR